MAEQKHDEKEDKFESKFGNDQDLRITLCLSGGGFRATFFHLGVIENLKHNSLLNKICDIYAVSGGSIVATHLVLNWSKYNGSNAQFRAATGELKAFGQRNIRGRVVRRWILSILFPFLRLFSGIYNRTNLLEREYETLYRNANLGSLSEISNSKPKLNILATSFTTGELCSFTSRGFLTELSGDSNLHPTELFSLAKAVTASSAFPPLFPPVKITREDINASSEEFPHSLEYLTDGGIYDNLGIDRIISTGDANENNEIVIISDASAPFDWNTRESFSMLSSRTIRASDILMKRVSEILLKTSIEDSDKKNIIYISISNSSDDPKNRLIPIDLQKRIPKIRTDLDDFSDFEQSCLTIHGFEVCESNLPMSLRINNETKTSSASNFNAHEYLAEEVARDRLDAASKRKLGLWSTNDWISYLLAGWIFIVSGAPVYVSVQYFLASRERDKAIAEKNEVAKQEEIARRTVDAISKSGAEVGLRNATEQYRRDFRKMIVNAGIKHIEPLDLLTLGATHARVGSPGEGLNRYPPEQLWPNIITTAKVVDAFVERYGATARIISAYRSPRYNIAIGGSRNSQHLMFIAVDFNVPDKGNPREWARILRELRSEGKFKGGVGEYSSFVHVDTRGTNIDW